MIHAVAYHDCPSDSIEDSFSSLTIIHTADALVSALHPELILQDVQLDEKYIAALNMTDRLPLWRGFYEQRMEGKKTQSA